MDLDLKNQKNKARNISSDFSEISDEPQLATGIMKQMNNPMKSIPQTSLKQLKRGSFHQLTNSLKINDRSNSRMSSPINDLFQMKPFTYFTQLSNNTSRKGSPERQYSGNIQEYGQIQPWTYQAQKQNFPEKINQTKPMLFGSGESINTPQRTTTNYEESEVNSDQAKDNSIQKPYEILASGSVSTSPHKIDPTLVIKPQFRLKGRTSILQMSTKFVSIKDLKNSSPNKKNKNSRNHTILKQYGQVQSSLNENKDWSKIINEQKLKISPVKNDQYSILQETKGLISMDNDLQNHPINDEFSESSMDSQSFKSPDPRSFSEEGPQALRSAILENQSQIDKHPKVLEGIQQGMPPSSPSNSNQTQAFQEQQEYKFFNEEFDKIIEQFQNQNQWRVGTSQILNTEYELLTQNLNEKGMAQFIFRTLQKFEKILQNPIFNITVDRIRQLLIKQQPTKQNDHIMQKLYQSMQDLETKNINLQEKVKALEREINHYNYLQFTDQLESEQQPFKNIDDIINVKQPFDFENTTIEFNVSENTQTQQLQVEPDQLEQEALNYMNNLINICQKQIHEQKTKRIKTKGKSFDNTSLIDYQHQASFSEYSQNSQWY